MQGFVLNYPAEKPVMKIHGWSPDWKAVAQLFELSKRPGYKFAMAFPDLHAGEIPVGHVTRTAGMAYYDLIGPDIGCNVAALPLKGNINAYVPGIAEYVFRTFTGTEMPSIGGGNHFFEIAQDEEDQYYFVLHTGSRSTGANTYRNIAKELKALGLAGVPIHSRLFENLHHGFEIAQERAQLNSSDILYSIIATFPISRKGEIIRTYHNTIVVNGATVDHYKGASYIRNGEKAIVPLSMRDGSLIVESVNTAPLFNGINHGAGRRMSRSEARKTLNEAEALKGINVLSKGPVLDEAPDAYKSINADMDALVEMGYIRILKRLRPIITVKS